MKKVSKLLKFGIAITVFNATIIIPRWFMSVLNENTSRDYSFDRILLIISFIVFISCNLWLIFLNKKNEQPPLKTVGINENNIDLFAIFVIMFFGSLIFLGGFIMLFNK